MSLPTAEQLVHDRINLGRLVNRLESSVNNESWDHDKQYDTWIKTQGALQRIKYARRLLKNVEADDPTPSSPKSAQRYRDMRISLDKTEEFVLAVDKRVAPKRTRPQSLLSKLPIPTAETSPEKPASLTLGVDTLLPADEAHPPLPTDDLLLSPAETSALPVAPADHQPLPSTSYSALPASTSTFPPSTLSQRPAKAPSPAFAQNSAALQQELSDQLAQMASQLKRNAEHFSESLAKDQAVVDDAQMKLEGNYDVMKKERLRVRDLRGKTGGTTCFVVASVVAVLLSFVIMVLLIRAT